MSERNEDLECFVDGNEANKRYNDIIFWLCSHAHHFSLSCRDGVDWDLRACQVLEELEPFLITEVRQNWWPGVDLHSAYATIYKCRCEEGAAQILTKYAKKFEEWTPIHLPEDLVFYRENDDWVFVHRTFCSMFLSSSEYEAFEREFPGLATPYSQFEE